MVLDADYETLRYIDVQLRKLLCGLNFSLVWYADWKLWVGLFAWGATWAKWLKFGYSASYYWKFLYTFGLNFLVLHAIQYHERQGLGAAMLILIAQCAGTTYLWWKNEDVLKRKGFTATSLYQDISTPFLQATTVFAGQMCLILFYLSAIFNTLKPETMSFVFWSASFICLQMSAFFNRGGDSLLGATWKTSEWTSVIMHASDVQFLSPNFQGIKAPIEGVHRNELIMRGLYGFTVNNVFRDILAFTVPILLSQFAKPLDFVVYCVGVNFIVTIDDMNPKKFDAVPKGGEPLENTYAPMAASDVSKASPPTFSTSPSIP